MNKDGKRILVIGLDGATFDVMKPMVDAGRLPTFSRLMNEGVWGPLRSTVLPVTPPAWASFMTGKNPGKHGVYGFYVPSEGSYQTEMVSGLSIKAKRIWDYLDNHERIGLIDIPMTFPPDEVNGCMISGWPVPGDDSIFTHPPELHLEIIREVGEYMIDKTFAALPKNDPYFALRELYRYTEMRRQAALHLLQSKAPFDFFMVVFRGTDFIQHEAFKFHDPEYCRANPLAAKKFGDVICQFYERMDAIAAELIDAMGKDAVTVIMSDHGAGPMKKRFYINRWLKKEGFLALKSGVKQDGICIKKKPLSEFLNRAGLSFVNRLISQRMRDIPLPHPGRYRKHPSAMLDWQNTKAFSNLTWTDGIIRINLKGREKEGAVEEKDYETIRSAIIEKLLSLKDPETGKHIVEKAFRREEIYSGTFLKDAPDILVLTAETSHVYSPALDDGDILERPLNPAPAPHRMDGVFIMNGAGIRQGGKLSGLDITDVAPTILYLMGKRIPESMDGRMMTDALETVLLEGNKPEYYKDNEQELAGNERKEMSEDEKRMMEESLRSLGYME